MIKILRVACKLIAFAFLYVLLFVLVMLWFDALNLIFLMRT